MVERICEIFFYTITVTIYKGFQFLFLDMVFDNLGSNRIAVDFLPILLLIFSHFISLSG